MNKSMLRSHIQWLKSNLWKYFIILFTSRRNFIPLLSIYYLSLPDAKAQEIGLYTAVWYAVSLIFQIPAGILWDKLGNKTAIVISKICLLLSSIMYVIGGNFWYFLVGSTLMSLWADAFATGNTSAFLHDTLTELKKENQFKKISSSMRWRVSLLSVFFIVALPFFTQISLVFPFKIWLGIDIIGLLVAFSLFPARWHSDTHEPISRTAIKTTLHQAKGTGLFTIIFFSATITWFLMVDGSFRTPYLQSLWYPIAYIGFVMGLSRLVRFVVGRYAHQIENIIPFRKLMFCEILLFSAYYISASYITNPYIVWLVFSLVTWYFWWRSDIYTDHVIRLIPGQKYKSTILSIKWQIISMIQIILMIGVGYMMGISYKMGFLVMGIVLFAILVITYLFFIRNITTQKWSRH